jgi:hypothetical protein
MNLPRYIVKKPARYLGHHVEEEEEGEGDDTHQDEEQEDYEETSEYFITPQTAVPVTTPYMHGHLRAEQIRFRVEEFAPSNFASKPVEFDGHLGDDEHYGIPVHDACWKIFERACKLRLGMVDLQGFVALWWVRMFLPLTWFSLLNVA